MRALVAVRSMTWLIVLAVGFSATLLSATAIAAPPVEGDEAALKQFLGSLRANEKKLPHGRFDFRSKGKLPMAGGRFYEASAEGNVAWSSDRERWDVSLTSPGPDPAKPPHTSHVLLIRSKDDYFSYLLPPKEGLSGIAKISAGRQIALDPLLMYFSPFTWWNFEGESRFPWASKLDPADAGPLVEKFVVTREGQEIRIAEQVPKYSPPIIVGSFAKGGNVISYDWPGMPDPPPKTLSWTYRGSYEWAETTEDRWYPKKIHLLRFTPEHPEDVKLDATFEITKFDPEQPDDSLFELRHVDLQRDTNISATDRNYKNRMRRLASDNKEENGKMLEYLAAEVGANGFVPAAE
jgi:hypothetical protein